MLDPNDEVYLRLFSKQEGNSKSKEEKSAFCIENSVRGRFMGST